MKRKPLIAALIFVAVVIAAIVYSTFGNARYRVEVCVTFRDRTLCRNGAATTREEAERIATDAACTDLTAGMSEFRQCEANAPRRATWRR